MSDLDLQSIAGFRVGVSPANDKGLLEDSEARVFVVPAPGHTLVSCAHDADGIVTLTYKVNFDG